LKRIAPESREFLVFLFTDLRDDLADQVGVKGPGYPGAGTVARKRAIYDALLSGLADDELSDDDTLREYVVRLAKATDEENQYEQAVLEHRAFAELVLALGGEDPGDSGAAAVDWDGLLASLLHPTQCQIIEAMHWIDRPVSASQLVRVFDRDPKDLSALSYHLRRLRALKIARLVSVRSVRGANERLYRLIVGDGQ
jgi:DNA-binding transcriptional ArsR family regulator